MSVSTKENILARWRTNPLLNAAVLSVAPLSAHDLSVDQPTQSVAAPMVTTTVEALQSGETHYVDVPGIRPLREKLATYLHDMGLTAYGVDHVLVTAGIQESRFLAIQKVGEQFGRIGMPSVVHPGAKLAAGVRAIEVTELATSSGDMLPSLAAIEAALQDGIKLIYLESPSRLTGAAYDEAAVTTLAGLLTQYDAAAIVDQGLAPWIEGYVSLGAQPDMASRVIVLGECWPGVGLESLAIGYAGVKPEWLEPMRAQKQIMAICTSTVSQYAAVAGADVYAAAHAGQLAALGKAHAAAVAAAKAQGASVVPGGAVSVLALHDNGLAEKLAAAGVLFADGADFGAAGTIRLAVTSDGATAQALA